MTKLEGALDDLQESLEAAQEWVEAMNVTPGNCAILRKKFNQATQTADELAAHFHTLKQREDAPTTIQKIRNMKNVFKDKTQLSFERALTETNFIKLKRRLNTLENALDKLEGLAH